MRQFQLIWLQRQAGPSALIYACSSNQSFWRGHFCLHQVHFMHYVCVIPSNFKLKVWLSLASSLVTVTFWLARWFPRFHLWFPSFSHIFPTCFTIQRLSWRSAMPRIASCRAMNFTGVLSSCSGWASLFWNDLLLDFIGIIIILYIYIYIV